jgi:hypothetical protein
MAKNTTQKKKAATGKQQVTWASGMPFKRINYMLMLAGFVVIAIGFILLSGGESKDPSIFSDAIFDTRRLTIAPITLLIGFGIELAAILVKGKSVPSEKTSAK